MMLAFGVMSGWAAYGQAVRPKYRVGDHVEFSSNGACLGDRFALPTKGTIVQVNLNSMSYLMQTDPEAGRASTTMSKPIYTQDCGFRLAPAAQNAVPVPPPARPGIGQETGTGAKFKVGDHVEFSLNNACLGAPFAIPTRGTILQVNLGTVMNYVFQVDPEPNKTQRVVSRPMAIEECGMKLLNTAAPEAPRYNCPLTAPAGPVTGADAASAQVFQRVIYDDAVEVESTHADVQRVGMSFELFQPGNAYVNNPIYHDGAPPNAVIYPIRVRYSKCIQRPDRKKLWVIEQNRDCFKNRQGEWACPVGVGETKFLTQIDLPN